MIEIIVETLQDALAAQAGRATQLDLKCASIDSGLTPSAGLVKQICQNVNIDVMMMIRPHALGFVYNHYDLDVMCEDIRLGHDLGVKGFLLGCLTEDGRVDVDATKRLQAAANPCSLNFHLAWEQTKDPSKALETIIDLGYKSVRITGGNQLDSKAIDGTMKIQEYFSKAEGRIEFFLAGGVSPENVADLVLATGVRNVHVGKGVRKPATAHAYVDETKVRQLAKELNFASSKLSK